MSTTRHTAPKAPAIEPALDRAALVLCAHGQGGSSAIADDLAARMRRSGSFARVEGCCINGSPDLAGTLRRLEESEIFVAPLLMAVGYTYRSVMAPLVARNAPPGARVRLCPPLGEAPGFGAVLLDQAAGLCDELGWAAAGTTLIVAAHGTPRASGSRDQANRLAAAIDHDGRFAGVATGFLEQAPFLADVLRGVCPAPCIVTGLFMDDGVHAGSDVPRIIASAHPRAAYTRAVGRAGRIPGLIVDMVRVEAMKASRA